MSKSLKIVLFVCVGLFVLYTALGFLAVPWAITNKLPSLLTEELNRHVSVQEAAFNPWLFKLQVKGFAIQGPDGSPLAGFDELFVDFEALYSLKNQAYTFALVRLGLPYGLAIVRPDGSLNLADLGKPANRDPSAEDVSTPDVSTEEPEGLPPVLIQEILIQQGMIEFRDVSKPTPFVAHLVPINLRFEKFSTKKDRANPYSLSAELGDGERITWEGTLTLNPFGSSGRLAFEKIRLETLWAYMRDQFRFQISQGLVNVNGQYEVLTTHDGMNVRVNEGNLIVHDLQIQEAGASDPVITVPLFEVKGVSVDVAKQSVTIPSIIGRDARFIGWVANEGIMNYQTLFAPVEASNDSSETVSPLVVEPESETTENPWVVVVEELDLDNFMIDVEDRQPKTPARMLVEALHFHTSQISSSLDKALPIDLSFQLNQTGRAELKGTVNLEPLSVEMDLALMDIALKPFEPYLAPFVQFTVGSGALTLMGKTRYQNVSKAEPVVTYAGSMGVSKLAFIDPESSQSFLEWNDLTFNGLALNVEPTTVKVKEIALVKPAVVFSLDPDGTSNIDRLLAPSGQVDASPKGEKEPAPEETASPPLPVQVETVRIDHLQLQLIDGSITPNVATKIEEFSGTIKGLSSEQLARADVDLAGTVDRFAPFRIKGQINPLSEDAYTDVNVVFENLNLPTISAYSGKYAGYPINKGKLSLNLAYKLSHNELVGENRVLVDQISMGNPVESPDAISLPIPLALALLKDRKGQIDIDLPVRGHLNDPDFSYGGVIWRALLNLITKIATSPFSLVGGLVGGAIGGNADALQYIEFPPGVMELSPTEQEKLVALGKALSDRPGLRLDIAGAVDLNLDGRALAEATLLTQMKKVKFLKQPPSGDQASAPLELLELTKEEKIQYLEQLFVEKFGELPLSKSTTTPDTQNSETSSQGKIPQPLTVEEKKAKLLDEVRIDEGQLRVLAQQRAQQIRKYVIQEAQVSNNQVFLVEVV
ncbi:MAG: DUF748 domain-containing protein, partial [Nitrospirales bacterium]